MPLYALCAKAESYIKILYKLYKLYNRSDDGNTQSNVARDGAFDSPERVLSDDVLLAACSGPRGRNSRFSLTNYAKRRRKFSASYGFPRENVTCRPWHAAFSQRQRLCHRLLLNMCLEGGPRKHRRSHCRCSQHQCRCRSPPPTGRAAAGTGSEQRRAASREIAGIFASAQYGVCHRQRRLVKCVRVRWWVRRANHRAKPAIRIGTPTRRFDGWLFPHHVFMLTKDTAVYCY